MLDLAKDGLVGINNFNPHDIKGLTALASRLGVLLPRRGDSLQEMFDAFGPHAVFTNNIAGAAERMQCEPGVAPKLIRDLITQSGVMSAIPLRNLVNGRRSTEVVDVFLLGGTAYWMELRIEELIYQFEHGLRINRIHALASGTRRAGAAEGSPERQHRVVQDLYDESYHEVGGPQWPTEAMVMERLVAEMYDETGLHGVVTRGEGNMEAQAATSLKSGTPFNLTHDVYVPANAPATHIPLQFFNVVRKLFTSVPPESMFFSQADRELATTAEELAPNGRQDAIAALSALPRLLAALYALNQTEG